jgi:putative transport protein
MTPVSQDRNQEISNEIHRFLVEHPVGLLFLVIGIGYLVGKLSIRGFDVGSVTGVLFAGLVFGHFGYEMNSTVQTMGFVLFIFSVGIQAGPRFFGVLRTDGLKYLSLAVVIAATGFTLAYVLARVMNFEPGVSAGILAGGLTSSPTLAAAQEALRSGQVPPVDSASTDQMVTNVSTAYAITYIFGLVGLILIIRLIPKVFGLDLKEEARKLAREQTGGVDDATTIIPDIVTRAYRIVRTEVTGIPLGELYARYPGLGSITRLRRAGEEIPCDEKTELQIDDEVVLVGFLHHVVRMAHVGEEFSDESFTNDAIESCRIVVLRSRLKQDASLGPLQIVEQFGCFPATIQRLGVNIAPAQVDCLEPGDVLHVTGPKDALDRLGAALGHIERIVDETDLVTVGLGITVGTFLGGFAVNVWGVSIGLGSAGGLLAVGLVIGYLRALHPTFGRVPGAARWIFMELGLLMFMAGVGLRAGSQILETLASAGPSLLLAGAIITSVPVAVGFVFGRYVLRIKPVLLLGAITGSMTSGASLSIVNREAGSSIPSLGYTGAYAFANILLTIAGSVILLL